MADGVTMDNMREAARHTFDDDTRRACLIAARAGIAAAV